MMALLCGLKQGLSQRIKVAQPLCTGHQELSATVVTLEFRGDITLRLEGFDLAMHGGGGGYITQGHSVSHFEWAACGVRLGNDFQQTQGSWVNRINACILLECIDEAYKTKIKITISHLLYWGKRTTSISE